MRTAGKYIVKTRKTYNSFLYNSSWTGTLSKVTENDNSQGLFKYYPSNRKVLQIRNIIKKLHLVKFSLHVEKVDISKKSKSLLCSSSELGVEKNHQSDLFQVGYWSVWADFGKEFRMIAKMKNDLDVANPGLKRNGALLEELPNVLNMVYPGQYIYLENNFKKYIGQMAVSDGKLLKPAAGV
jgi:hypothetical protein